MTLIFPTQIFNLLIPALGLLLLFQVKENAGADPLPITDEFILQSFQNISEVSSSDCAPKSTNWAIRWLKSDGKDSGTGPKPTENEEKAQFNLFSEQNKLFTSRVEFNKLRRFLYNKGFLSQPGNLFFAIKHPNHRTLKLTCGEEKDKAVTAIWKSEGLKNAKDNDANTEFNKDAGRSPRVSFKSPSSQLYFQKFFCEKTDKKCTHHFYHITRPFPKVDNNIHHQEGSDFEFSCSIYPCLYNNKKSEGGCEKVLIPTPNFQKPVKFYWTFPNETAKEVSSTADISPKFKDSFKITTKTFPPGFVVKSTIHVKNVQKKHAGKFECVVVDENGVPSTPSKPEARHHPLGEGNLHVREKFYMYIPLGVLGLIFIIMILIEAFAPKRFEYDDGAVYTKEELADNTKSEKSNVNDQEEEEGGGGEIGDGTGSTSKDIDIFGYGPNLEHGSNQSIKDLVIESNDGGGGSDSGDLGASASAPAPIVPIESNDALNKAPGQAGKKKK